MVGFPHLLPSDLHYVVFEVRHEFIVLGPRWVLDFLINRLKELSKDELNLVDDRELRPICKKEVA